MIPPVLLSPPVLLGVVGAGLLGFLWYRRHEQSQTPVTTPQGMPGPGLPPPGPMPGPGSPGLPLPSFHGMPNPNLLFPQPSGGAGGPGLTPPSGQNQATQAAANQAVMQAIAMCQTQAQMTQAQLIAAGGGVVAPPSGAPTPAQALAQCQIYLQTLQAALIAAQATPAGGGPGASFGGSAQFSAQF